MRKSLLTTVAMAAVVGFGGIAAAQSQTGGDSNKGASGAAQEQKSGGSMSGAQSQSSGESAQGMEKGKSERAHEERGLQKNQKGAHEERGSKLKGAEEQRGTSVKGAQEERGTQLKGAQEQRGTSTTEQSKTGVNENVGTRGSRGASVQLSEDQRSHIKTIIGKERGPRLGSNANFDVTVGTRIPRNVDVVALPEEIVRIVPEYRGYEYFLSGDEIVIVDPSTLQIVAVIPA